MSHGQGLQLQERLLAEWWKWKIQRIHWFVATGLRGLGGMKAIRP